VTPFFDQLGEELDRAAQRLHRQRQRRAFVAKVSAAAALVVVAVGIAMVIDRGDDEAAADIRVVTENGVVIVTLPQGREPADDVADKLEDAGLQVRQQPSSTGPSQLGKVVGMVSSGGVPTTDPDGTITIRLPASSTITLLVGAPWTSGSYAAFTDALATGEPLNCVAWKGQDATDLTSRIPSGLVVEYRTEDDQSISSSELNGFVVKEAAGLSPTLVIVTVQSGDAVDAPECQ
jgi:hypothetical protein